MNVEWKYGRQLAYFDQVRVEDEEIVKENLSLQNPHKNGKIESDKFSSWLVHLLPSLGENMQVDICISVQHSLNVADLSKPSQAKPILDI